MTSTAREIRSHGCPVVLSGPFTQQIHDARRWRAWVADLGGGTVRLVWVRSDAATLRHRLGARGSGRDAAKLADFAGFTASMRLGAAPAAPHAAIDNRLTASATLEDQVTALVAGGLLTGAEEGDEGGLDVARARRRWNQDAVSSRASVASPCCRARPGSSARWPG